MLTSLSKAILLILLGTMTVACTETEEASAPPTPDQVQALIPFHIIDNGKISGIAVEKAALFTFNDEPTFHEFWARHHTVSPIPQPPAVDFNTETVFAVLDSDQPNGGYYLRFDKIEQINNELWVYVTREQPATECMNMGMIAQPYVMVTLPKTNIKSKLVFKTSYYAC